jgi:hypothetical protein
VLSKESKDSYKILVNVDNMNHLPVGNVGEKLIECVQDLKSDDLIYAYHAELDETTRKVYLKEFTVISSVKKEGQAIPQELLTLANLSEITPYDMMTDIYSTEEEEDEEDDEPSIQDSEDEEGS